MTFGRKCHLKRHTSVVHAGGQRPPSRLRMSDSPSATPTLSLDRPRFSWRKPTTTEGSSEDGLGGAAWSDAVSKAWCQTVAKVVGDMTQFFPDEPSSVDDAKMLEEPQHSESDSSDEEVPGESDDGGDSSEGAT